MNAPLTQPLRTANNAWADATPDLAVLIPFHGHDPAPLVRLLDHEARASAGRVELVLLDDGGPNPAHSQAAAEAVQAAALPALLLTLTRNEGRAKGRNRLAAAARAPRFLFLDSDMAPDAPDFLGRWLALIDAQDPPCAVGGFSLDQVTPAPKHRLHAALQLRAECMPAEVRAKQPEKYVYTSNLLVRREVFEAEGFDEGFSGWGWEDTEWGMRVAARFGVAHIENPATHLGLDTAEQLARKYAQSGPNFARAAAKHPDVIGRYPSYRMAKALKPVPGRRAFGRLCLAVALSEAAPLKLRVAAMKLYRAELYAEAIP